MGPVMPLVAAVGSGISSMAAGIGSAVTSATAGMGLTGGLSNGIMWSSGRIGMGSLFSGLGTGLKVLGALQAGSAAGAAADMNARVARNNARWAEYKTGVELSQQDRARRLRQGAARAQGAATGGITGSAADIIADNAAQEEMDLMTIRTEGMLRAGSYRANAAMDSARADSSRMAGYIGAGSRLLSGAADLVRV